MTTKTAKVCRDKLLLLANLSNFIELALVVVSRGICFGETVLLPYFR